MKKILISTLGLLVLVMLAAVGCSKKEEPANTDTKGTAMNSSTNDAYAATDTTKPDSAKTDSVTLKIYPIRNPKNKFVTLETDFGKMVLELYKDVAPAHADSFVSLSKKGFYNGTIFHRVIKNFMIQGGDPKGNGTGNAGYYLKAEFNELPHQDGTLSMARSMDPNSASSQFFVCLGRNSMTSNLDRQYTVFGQLIRGFETLHQIGDVRCVQNPGDPRREISKPAEDVYLRRAYVSDSLGNSLNPPVKQ
ncbi:MAG: peptidylprolyl isomerase [Candidatus Zixiibacteriota bacterium]